jgi:3-dehydroquinate synthase
VLRFANTYDRAPIAAENSWDVFSVAVVPRTRNATVQRVFPRSFIVRDPPLAEPPRLDPATTAPERPEKPRADPTEMAKDDLRNPSAACLTLNVTNRYSRNAPFARNLNLDIDLPMSPPAEATHTVTVRLASRSYDVRVVSGVAAAFGPFARGALDATWAGRSCRLALIVTDENVAPRAGHIARALHEVGIVTAETVLPPGEYSKTLAHADDLFDKLVKLRADRHTCVVALGGGVIGDLAGFVAATYARGIPLLMVPTTLLAQVDSSVGGKVGVNHPRAKNMIGAFHQPVAVWIDTDMLATLPARELRCGLAEVIKYGVILDAALFAYLEENVEAILALEPGPIRHIVARSCELKADVVTRDEREETGLRSVLNFGHTFGHAVESVCDYSDRFHHGEAVAVGMIAACRLAERMAWVDRDTTDRLVALVCAFGLPTAAPGLDPDALYDAMTRDKKNRAGRVRFVLPRSIGQVELTDAPSEADVRGILGTL